MSISELIDKYVKEFCPICTDKKNCNIRIYNDHKNKIVCCKCVYFNSDNSTKNELKSN